MSRFVFRTAAGKNIGIGHVMRCLHLAREIEAREGQCLFVLDHLPNDLHPFLQGQEVVCLYDAVQDEIDPHRDADLFLEHATGADWVILDDYRIHQAWEEVITARQNGIKLCVLDDLERSHTCDVIIDMGSRGAQSRKDWDGRVPGHCKKLLGPKYAILSAPYQQDWRKKKKHTPFTILISLGGSGDMEICAGITDALLEAFEEPVHINILVGPLSQNQEEVNARYQDNENVTCLTGIKEAYPVLRETDFYIGAAGTMLFQLRCLNIPALTFSLVDNQKNNIFNLEEIGHYFHLNSWMQEDFPAFATFARTVHDHYGRVLQMGANPEIEINGMGSQYIADCLFAPEKFSSATAMENKHSREDEPQLIRLATGYALRPVTDQDINLYRHSRNLENNHKFMTLAKKVPTLGHYNWWFRNTRESFILEKDGKASLVIWHQRVPFEGHFFMNSGWFVCDEKGADFKDVMLAMNWQVKYCDEHHTGIPWLSVVNKNNKFAKQIDDYFGFEEMDKGHPYYHACCQMFPAATEQDFYYVVYDKAHMKTKGSGRRF